MQAKFTHTQTGLALISGAILVNIPYTLLTMNFEYPEILRQPAGEILTRFAAGGSSLIWTWLAFAWIGMPILLGMLWLPRSIQPRPGLLLQTAAMFGITAGVAQMLGLLRWVFVVPVLANLYTDPSASAATKDAVVVAFQVLNQYGGVVMGEHLGQAWTVLWMFLTSLALLPDRRFGNWLSWLGVAASGTYLLAQGELFATVLPGFPNWSMAGMVGSLLWLGWVIALGICLVRLRPSDS